MCNVVPKDLFIERGSSAEIMCDTSCLPRNVYWTLDKKLVNDTSMSKRINSTHTVLTLSQFTNHNATLQCHREFSNEVLGGTIIRTYSKECFWELWSWLCCCKCLSVLYFITSTVFAFLQQNPEYHHVFSILKIKIGRVHPTCSHANGRMKLTLHWKKNTPFSSKTLHILRCICEIMQKRGLFICTN